MLCNCSAPQPSRYHYDHIWHYTYGRDVVEWASTEWVQRTLAQMMLRQFLTKIENVTDNVAESINVSERCLSFLAIFPLLICAILLTSVAE